MTRMLANREVGLIGVSLACAEAAVSVSFALVVLACRRISTDTTPAPGRRLVMDSISKPPVSVDLADTTVSTGVGVSSRSCSSTVAKDSGLLLDFGPYWDLTMESMC
jgi:hypothetical protein